MDAAVTYELVAQVKRKIRVTWKDDATEARIVEDMIPSGMADIRLKVGIPDDADVDFSAPGQENKLLLAWCYYEWNDAVDDFEANYAIDIAQARRRWEVIQFVKEKEGAA